MSRLGSWTVLLAAAATSGCATEAGSASPAASTSAAESSAVGTSAAESSASSWADWEAPDGYRFTVDSSCGERPFLGVYRVTVRGGDVIAADYDHPLTGATVALEPEELQSWVPTLEDMLDEARGATGDPEAGEIEVVTDPADGHPTKVSVDHIESAIDDESCYVVTDYEPGG